jgi:choline dehydrogenase-like flavoprotein
MTEFDYLVVGGGTAGCIVATRLAEDPAVSVGLVEWGPSDEDEPRARSIRQWAEMLEGEYDLDYRSVPQERGNSGIRQARLRILGGCSTANTMIAWRPRVADLQEWVDLGADGWDAARVHPYYERLQAPITPVPPQDQNPFVAGVVSSASSALNLPVRSTWNDEDVIEGTGFFEIGYRPETNTRSSSSLCYLHPALRRHANLRVLLQTRALRLLLDGGNRAAGVLVRTGQGAISEIFARREVVVCAGAIDSPRLLQLSGIGPAAVLEDAGVDVRVDLPGVGANLMDHAEGIVVWEVAEPPSRVCATGWDAGALLRLTPGAARPDVTMHFPVEAWVDHVVARCVQMPPHYMAIAPNVAKPRSRGRVWITSAGPDERPAIDYRYFTDPDGTDEAVLVAAGHPVGQPGGHRYGHRGARRLPDPPGSLTPAGPSDALQRARCIDGPGLCKD